MGSGEELVMMDRGTDISLGPTCSQVVSGSRCFGADRGEGRQPVSLSVPKLPGYKNTGAERVRGSSSRRVEEILGCYILEAFRETCHRSQAGADGRG